MELMTPQILWKDFDTQAPFDETLLRYTYDGERKIKEFYFNGLRVRDGIVRIFARYYHKGDDKPTIVFFGEVNEELTIPKTCDYNFLVADYSGLKKGKSRCTVYPYSLVDAQNDKAYDNLNPKESRWYAWASVAMYTVLYAQKCCGNGKVGIVGVGEGGSLVWKLSASVSATAGVTLFSTGYEPDIDDLNYRACLDNRSYAPLLKFPVMEIISSNERDGSIDFMSEIFAAIKRTDCRLYINERSDHKLGEAGRRNAEQWLGYYLDGEGQIPAMPTLKSYESGGKLYYEITYAGNPGEISFLSSVGNIHGAVRNWSNAKLIKLEDKHLANIDVIDADAPVNAFVNVSEYGYRVSSIVSTRVPSKMGIASRPAKRNRLVYDGDMGIDDWTLMSSEKPVMRDGPYGISGVYAPQALITFKLADIRFRGVEGGILQIMFCTDKTQTIEFVITDAKKRRFVNRVEANEKQGWVTKNFVIEDFKLQNESITWADVVTFEVLPLSGSALVSSLLWV